MEFKYILDLTIIALLLVFIINRLQISKRQRDEITQLKAELVEADIHRAYSLPSPAALENWRLRMQAEEVGR